MATEHDMEFYFEDGKLDINRLFIHYSKPLFYFALKFVDEEQAKDIVQDVFYKLWEDKTIQITSSLNGLLFAMVRNKCLQQLEKQKVREQYQQSAGISLKEEELQFYSTYPSGLIQHELQEQLEKAMAKLPDKCREVFELSRFHSKKNKEIAVELGINIKTVEKHISRALSQIRSELKDYFPMLLVCHWLLD
jgi:RNA polymerase sigma-70 factor (ECF subfamily)